MIYVVVSHYKIKEENVEKFQELLVNFMKQTKKEELNLSIDAYWKNKSELIVVERWSEKKAYEAYYAQENVVAIVKEYETFLMIKKMVTKNNTIL